MFAGVLLVFWWLGVFQQAPRKALPSTADEVHEYNSDRLFPPDYCYYLKAKITQEEFNAYRKRLRFAPLPQDLREEFDWSPFGDKVEEWWDPTPSLKGAFYNPTATGSQRALMKYENGFVYYKETAGL